MLDSVLEGLGRTIALFLKRLDCAQVKWHLQNCIESVVLVGCEHGAGVEVGLEEVISRLMWASLAQRYEMVKSNLACLEYTMPTEEVMRS